MKYFACLLSLSAICLLFACGGGGDSQSQENGTVAPPKVLSKVELSKVILDAETVLAKDTTNTQFDRKRAFEMVKNYSQFAERFASDTRTPDYLFKAGEIYRSLRNFKKATEAYETIHSKYNSYEKAPHSLFLLGFSYENDLQDTQKAKATYEQFLSSYPDHELADDVQFSLENLGRPAEDIIKEFEKKRQEVKESRGQS